MDYAVVDPSMASEELEPLLHRNGRDNRDMVVDLEQKHICLPMPGLSREELEVQQIGSCVVLLSRGQRRLINLPTGLERMICCGARLEQGMLLLRFG